jgi:hypothetical protein
VAKVGWLLRSFLNTKIAKVGKTDGRDGVFNERGGRCLAELLWLNSMGWREVAFPAGVELSEELGD